MRTAIPTDLLVRLMNASPEQFAQVERVLGCKTDNRNQRAEIGSANRHLTPALSPSEAERELACEDARPTSEDVARSAFALLQKLELDAPLKAPSVLTVFRLYCVDGMSAERVARKCQCGKATVIRRLQLIEERTGMKAEEFRAMSGHLQRLDDDFKSSGAREIYRRGLAGGED